MHIGNLSWILGGLDTFNESSRDVDLVEYRSGPNHDDAGNDFEIDNRLSGETKLSIVELECSNCLCEELWLRISALQVTFVLLHKKNDPASPVHHADIRLRVHLTPTCEKWDVFTLAYDAIGLIVAKHAKNMGSKIIHSRLLSPGGVSIA